MSLPTYDGEGLAAGLVLLAVALDPVAEHLVEEHAGGAALEDRRADVRLGERRVVERVEIARSPVSIILSTAASSGQLSAGARPNALLEPRRGP